MNKEIIKVKILDALVRQGFSVDSSCEISSIDNPDKDQIRFFHGHFRAEKLKAEKNFAAKNLNKLRKFFANGEEINPYKIDPTIHLIEANTEYSDLFRLATLLWSIPVSQGFGRRKRFVVIDKSNGKLIGLFAIGDPIFNLKARDEWIGWNQAQRRERLYNLMDLYVAGAIPPYSQLLCGKLIAMLASSNYVRNIVWETYKRNITTINKENKAPHLVLLTTLSALGRSSLYNRIKFEDRPLFIKIGDTSGWGHFHLSNSTFDLMRNYLVSIDHPIVKKNRFGDGPNWKIRTIRTCLESLELPTTILNHGIKREIYICPLAKNYIEYLRGEHSLPEYFNNNTDKIIEYFKIRWLIPRFKRSSSFREVSKYKTLSFLTE